MEGVSYGRLGLNEREEISRYLAQGWSFREISRDLSRHVSTISREINRAGMNRYTYRASRSDRRARRNAAKRRRGKHKLGLNQRLWDYICGKLKLRWSREQIAQSLRREYPDDQAMRISPVLEIGSGPEY